MRPFLSLRGRKALYTRGNVPRKIIALLSGLLRRIGDLFLLSRYKYIYIHRWATTAGPPVFEWLIVKIFRKKLVYDFDDAIWVRESAYNKKFLAVKFLGKIARICRWAQVVTVGNAYLKSFADKYNGNTIIIPTVVNTETTHNRLQDQSTSRPAVGWTGSFSTLIYLESIIPIIKRLQEKHDFTFFVIADKDPAPELVNYQFIHWNKDSEAEDLLKFHIGLMPLPDDEITRGKCGFKAIQYMSLGMPALVSAVGVNTEIVNHNKDGFICNTEQEWENTLERLLTDAALRKEIGLAARKKIEEKYSVKVTCDRFISLFK